jgi:hypothetical protein
MPNGTRSEKMGLSPAWYSSSATPRPCGGLSLDVVSSPPAVHILSFRDSHSETANAKVHSIKIQCTCTSLEVLLLPRLEDTKQH